MKVKASVFGESRQCDVASGVDITRKLTYPKLACEINLKYGVGDNTWSRLAFLRSKALETIGQPLLHQDGYFTI